MSDTFPTVPLEHIPTIANDPPTDTVASIRAATDHTASLIGSPEAVTKAVEQANASDAPASALEQFVQTLHRRLSQIEELLGLVKPVAQLAEGVVEAEAPQTKPLIDAVNEGAALTAGIIDALNDHFGGKVPLPTVPAKTAG